MIISLVGFFLISILKLALFNLVIIWQAGEATKIRTTIEIVKRKINVSPLIISNFYNFSCI